jgi:hypothetical protein
MACGKQKMRVWAGAAAVTAMGIAASSAMALPKVAIVAAANASPTHANYTDPQAKLMGTGLFDLVDVIPVTAATPSLASLMTYDAIIVWSNSSFLDGNALGDVVADYVDAGKGVVVTTFATTESQDNRFLGGRFASGGYSIILPGGGTVTGATNVGTAHAPTHPIAAGITNISSGTAGRPSDTRMLGHGVRVLEWADGKPLVTVSTTFPKRVDLGIYPPSSTAASSNWLATTQGAQLMGQALVFASGASAASVPPVASVIASPSFATQGSLIGILAHVAGGANPASTGVSVTANLSAFGGSSTQPLNAQGDGSYAVNLSVPAAQPLGLATIMLTVTDAQGRSSNSPLTLRVYPAMGPGFDIEVEPNESKSTASQAVISHGQGVFGFTSGSSTAVVGDASADQFLVKTGLLPPGIYRHRMIITTSGGAGHTGTIRGLTQSAGVISVDSNGTIQTSSATTSPTRFNQWYGFGHQEQVYYRVTGSAATTGEYVSTLETTPVTPIDAGAPFTPGSITIERAAGVTTTLDMVVYDSSFNAYSDALSEGTNPLTRTYPAGTYYLGVSNVNTADHRATPPDSPARNNVVMDFAGAVANSVTTLVPSMSVTFTDAGGQRTVSASKDGPFDVVWIKFTVGAAQEVCCRGTTCLLVDTGTCAGTAGGSTATVVGPACTGNTVAGCCYADYDHINGRTIDDIFIFLNAWFAASPYTKVGGNGVDTPVIDDIFVFLNVWFAGCS